MNGIMIIKKINSMVINCVKIEQTIKQINILNEKINKHEDSKEIDLKFIYEDELNKIKESIQKFGFISSNEIDNEEVKTLILCF